MMNDYNNPIVSRFIDQVIEAVQKRSTVPNGGIIQHPEKIDEDDVVIPETVEEQPEENVEEATIEEEPVYDERTFSHQITEDDINLLQESNQIVDPISETNGKLDPSLEQSNKNVDLAEHSGSVGNLVANSSEIVHSGETVTEPEEPNDEFAAAESEIFQQATVEDVIQMDSEINKHTVTAEVITNGVNSESENTNLVSDSQKDTNEDEFPIDPLPLKTVNENSAISRTPNPRPPGTALLLSTSAPATSSSEDDDYPRRFSKSRNSNWDKKSSLFFDALNTADRPWTKGRGPKPNIEITTQSLLESTRKGWMPDGSKAVVSNVRSIATARKHGSLDSASFSYNMNRSRGGRGAASS